MDEGGWFLQIRLDDRVQARLCAKVERSWEQQDSGDTRTATDHDHERVDAGKQWGTRGNGSWGYAATRASMARSMRDP
jgi:hypothetical protein